jgi:hypothetical protein
MEITVTPRVVLGSRLGVIASDDVVDVKLPAGTAATGEGDKEDEEEGVVSEGVNDEVD